LPRPASCAAEPRPSHAALPVRRVP
jgi:hypothetical protein